MKVIILNENESIEDVLKAAMKQENPPFADAPSCASISDTTAPTAGSAISKGSGESIMKVVILNNGKSVEDALKAAINQSCGKESPTDTDTSITKATNNVDEIMNDAYNQMDELEAEFESFVRNRQWIHVMRDLPKNNDHLEVFVQVSNSAMKMSTHLNDIAEAINKCLTTLNPKAPNLFKKCIKSTNNENDSFIEDEDISELVSKFKAMEARLIPICSFIETKMELLGFENDDKDDNKNKYSKEDCCGRCDGFLCD